MIPRRDCQGSPYRLEILVAGSLLVDFAGKTPYHHTMELELRECNSCHRRLPLTAYRQTKKGNHRRTCQDCRLDQAAARLKLKKPYTALEIRQAKRRAAKVNLTSEDYFSAKEKSNGICAICKEAPTTKHGLHWDHDHETGQARDFLCHGCNVGLGHFRDNPKLLQAAIDYLKRWNDCC
jgi:hypothetical protein